MFNEMDKIIGESGLELTENVERKGGMYLGNAKYRLVFFEGVYMGAYQYCE